MNLSMDLRPCVAFRGQGKQQAVFLLGVVPPVGESLSTESVPERDRFLAHERQVCEGCAALLLALKSAPYDVRTYFAHQSSTSVAMKR